MEKPVKIGTSFSAVTVKVRPSPLDASSSPAASITFNRSSRLAVGVSELLAYVRFCINASIETEVALDPNVIDKAVPALPPERVPITKPLYVTSPPAKPICPEPEPWLRKDTVSSDKSPVSVSVPPLKFPSASVKLTSLSISCGALFTVFSAKVANVEKPVKIGASSPSSLTTILKTKPSDAISSPTASLTFKRTLRVVVGLSELLA